MNHLNKIIFIHPAVRTYRIELYELLSERFQIDFFWSGQSDKDSVVDIEVQKILSETDIKYIQAKEFKYLSIDNLSWQLLKLPFMSYNIYIFSGVTSVPYLLLAPFLKLLKKKIILFDELWKYPVEVSKYRVIYPYVKFLTKYCLDSVVVAGGKSKVFYEEELKYDKERIFIAYNTTQDSRTLINNAKLNSEIKKKLDNLTAKKKILFLARIVSVKGLEILIQAMQNISASHDLIIVGDGECLAENKVLVSKLGLNLRVHFVGSCLAHESVYYYSNCDIFSLPSKVVLDQNSQLESWGFTVNEAMALEIPVVSTTAVGSAHDLLIDGVTGMIAQESNIKSLEEKINYVINNNNNNILGQNGRKHLMKICNYQDNFKAYENAISKALDE